MEYKFMQLFGNCACIKYLGKNRLRGPVDNVDCLTLDVIKLLLSNKYYDTLMTANYKTAPHIPMFETDSNIKYLFNFVQIIHINPFTEKHKKELKSRIARFNKFYQKVKTDPNYFFTISLNQALVDRHSHTLNTSLCKKIIEYLKSKNLLKKCIFVGTKLNKEHNDWNYWSNDFTKIIKQYHLNYVEIVDLNLFKKDTSYAQFKNQVEKLLKTKESSKKPKSYLETQNYFGL